MKTDIKLSNEDLILTTEMEKKYPKMTAEFRNICAEQYLMFLKKQHDYGPSNIAINTQLETDEDIKNSLIGITVRCSDKVSRLVNLILKRKDEKPKNESIVDTFVDMSIYSKIAMIVLRGKWAK